MNRSSLIPLWAQLAADLQVRIGKGEFEDKFPTEEDIVQEYGVSRYTVRESIRKIAEQGLLQRHQGRGTFVVHPRLEQPLAGFYSLACTISDTGVKERSEVRVLELRQANIAGERLGLDPNDECLYIERLRYAGNEPLALDKSYLPADMAAPLLEIDLTSGSLYDHLAKYCDTIITEGLERIRPINPTLRDRDLLHLPQKEAAFSLERITKSSTRTVEWRSSIVRGDRYQFVVEWPTVSTRAKWQIPT